MKCLAIIDRIDEHGIVVTEHGKPVTKLTPIRAELAALIGALEDRMPRA